MRFKIQFLLAAFASALNAQAQGFINLDFESANVSGYSPNSSDVPTGSAFPGWSASFAQPGVGSSPAPQVAYDAISLGGCVISINDINTGFGFVPVQGQFSAFLFGGSFQCSSTISQTGLVPSGTMSLQVKMQWSSTAPVISVGGQIINMVPLQTFPNYTLHGGDISSFAGQSVALSFTEPPPLNTPPPSGLIIDDIVFSSQAVPEPSAVGLFTFGALLLGWRIQRRSKA